MPKFPAIRVIGWYMLGLVLILTVFVQCFWPTLEADGFDWDSVNTLRITLSASMYSAMIR